MLFPAGNQKPGKGMLGNQHHGAVEVYSLVFRMPLKKSKYFILFMYVPSWE